MIEVGKNSHLLKSRDRNRRLKKEKALLFLQSIRSSKRRGYRRVDGVLKVDTRDESEDPDGWIGGAADLVWTAATQQL